MPRKGIRIKVERNVFLLGLTSLFNDISSEMIYPIIPIFLTSVLGAPISVVGIIEGIAESTASILKGFSGWFSDRFQKRKGPALLGYIISTLSKPLLVFSFFWWQVLVARFIDRAGKGIRTSPRDALIADSSPKEDYGRSFGFHRSLDTLGATIGPLLAFILLPLLNEDYRLLFILSIIPAGIAVLILGLLVKEKRHTSPLQKLRKVEWKLFNRDFRLFLIIVFIFTIGNSSDVFLILRAKDLGISIVLIPLVYLVFNLVHAFLATPAGIISDNFGRKRIMLFGFIIFSLVYFGFAVVQSSWFVWILFALYGAYYAFTEGIFKAYIADIVDEQVRGTAYGLLNMFLGLFLLPASIIAGVLWDTVGATAPFYLGSITAIFAFFLTFVLLPSTPAIQKTRP